MAYMKTASGRRLDALEVSKESITPGLPARRLPDNTIMRAEFADGVPEFSDPARVYCLGDSTTQGNQDGTGITWPAELSKMLDGITVVNGGLSGRTSTELAMRFGAIVPLLTFTGGSVPASGSATVTATPTTTWRAGVVETISYSGFIQLPNGTSIAGTLQLNESTNVFTFVRTSAGAAVALSGSVPFYMTLADSYRDAIVVSALGINNYAASTFDDVLRDNDAVRRHLTPNRPKMLALPILTGTGQGIGNGTHDRAVSTNGKTERAFGADFLDHRRKLIDQGLQMCRITGDGADLTDQQSDTVPHSLLFDGIHPKGVTYKAYARIVGNKLVDKGWVKPIDPMNIPGALVIIEPGAPWNPWAGGVPADGNLLPNLALHRLLDLGIEAGLDTPWAMDATMNDGTHGIMERTSKGGIHGIVSQANPPANNIGAGLVIDPAIVAYMAANPTHEFYAGYWARVTRAFSGSFSYVFMNLSYNASGNYRGYGYLGTGTPVPSNSSGLRRSTYQENQNTAGASFQDVSGLQDTPLASAMSGVNSRVAATWGRLGQPNGTLTNLPSWVFYKFVLIDLTEAKRSRAEIHALNFADFTRQVKTSGGRYNSDTFTNPSTLA